MSTRWTPEEDGVIRQFWPLPGSIPQHVHKLPGRTVQAIEKRARRLQLPRRIIWTPEMDAELAQVWKTGGRIKEQMHRFPGHSVMSICQRACMLGLGNRGHHGKAERPSWIVIKKHLEKQPDICHRIAAHLRLHIATAYALLRARHRMGEIHIHDWERLTTSGRPVPVYAIGAGVDKPSPALSGAAKEKKYRQARLHQRVLAGKTVKTINPFAAAAGLVAAPKGKAGRVIKHLHDDDREAA